MKEITFIKMSGAGNNFIAIDARKIKLPVPLSKWAKAVCDPQYSISADGVLFLENSKKADFKMRIINSDGSEAEMCGNGIRCMAKFAFLRGIKKRNVTIETKAGIKETSINGNSVVVNMGAPANLKTNIPLKLEDKFYVVHHVNTGVPHTILFTGGKITVKTIEELGRKIRFHKKFAPKGTNADFVRIINKNTIETRVYERGVEGETLACGTGACASAYISVLLRKVKFPVNVITSSGEKLTINIDKEKNLFMKGPVSIICKGVLYENIWRGKI